MAQAELAMDELFEAGFDPADSRDAVVWIEELDRLAGLRHPEQMQAVASADATTPAFAGGCWRDGAGRLWQEIRLSMLPREERFLRIVAAR